MSCNRYLRTSTSESGVHRGRVQSLLAVPFLGRCSDVWDAFCGPDARPGRRKITIYSRSHRETGVEWFDSVSPNNINIIKNMENSISAYLPIIQWFCIFFPKCSTPFVV